MASAHDRWWFVRLLRGETVEYTDWRYALAHGGVLLMRVAFLLSLYAIVLLFGRVFG